MLMVKIVKGVPTLKYSRKVISTWRRARSTTIMFTYQV